MLCGVASRCGFYAVSSIFSGLIYTSKTLEKDHFSVIPLGKSKRTLF